MSIFEQHDNTTSHLRKWEIPDLEKLDIETTESGPMLGQETDGAIFSS